MRGEACTRQAQAALLADKLHAGQTEVTQLRLELAQMKEHRDSLALMLASPAISFDDDDVFCMEL